MICAPRYQAQWDYSQQARYYHARPNYSGRAIDALVAHVAFPDPASTRVADIGAGTGNLAVLLAERGFRPVAVEPNMAMMEIGLRLHADRSIYWKLGDAEHTGLQPAAMDWVTFGSSFGTAERHRILCEVQRILSPGGWFTCMWNHRDIDNDPMQARVEQIIRDHYPDYSHGVRREDQTPVLRDSQMFRSIHYIEESFLHQTTMDRYKDAWRSVKNNLWGANTVEGQRLVESILADIEREFGSGVVQVPYTTRIWAARLA